MIASIKRYLRKQVFYPDALGVFVNPFFFARRGLVKEIKAVSAAITGRILDVGCGSKPYQSLFTYTEYIGVDIENPGHDHAQEQVDVFYDGKRLPFPDHSFDSVISNQVFEHVFNPPEFLAELYRILKPGGNLLLTVPFVWDEHEQPNDFARYSSFGIQAVLKQAGFEVISLTKSVDDIRVVFQMITLYVYKKTVTRNNLLNRVIVLVLISPWNILGSLVHWILPRNKDLYLDNIVLARKSA